MASKDALHEQNPVAVGSRVTLHFSLALEDGAVIDSNFERRPATFTVGDGNLLPGFEAKLLGLSAGQEITVTLPPEQAFGEVSPANVQYMARSRFSRFLDDEYEALTPGAVVAFKDAGGFDLHGVIQDVDTDGARIDFNHPLAGRRIQFRARIVNVIPADTQALSIRL
ncbi:MAG: hypothetical protein RLZZ385_2209 [Pseudomonadota bacterium]|jgi:FKBP-type peptidyl-prolyl cis-trans isomerase SlpA